MSGETKTDVEVVVAEGSVAQVELQDVKLEVKAAAAVAAAPTAVALMAQDALDKKVTVRISNRGMITAAPENTHEAIQAAIESKQYAMISLDVRLTKDKQLVLCHDDNLSDLMAFKKQCLSKMTRKEIEPLRMLNKITYRRDGRVMRANYKAATTAASTTISADDKFSKYQIAFLDEVFDVALQHTMLHLDLQDPSYSRVFGRSTLVRELVAFLKTKTPEQLSRVLISSANPAILSQVEWFLRKEKLSNQVELAADYRDPAVTRCCMCCCFCGCLRCLRKAKMPDKGVRFVLVQCTTLTQSLINAYNKAGVRVIVYGGTEGEDSLVPLTGLMGIVL